MNTACKVWVLACLLGLMIQAQSQAVIQENISHIASNFHAPSGVPNYPGLNQIPGVPGGSESSGTHGGSGASGTSGVNNAKLAEFLMDPCTIKTFMRLAELSREVNEAQNSNSGKEQARVI